MLSTQSWPRPAYQVWTLAQRFQKFVVVGAVGLAVNQGLLFLLAGIGSASLTVSSPIAILVSMAVTFLLNEIWTWHDRGSGRVLQRAVLYSTINSGGLIINWGVLLYLEREWGMHYLLANLVGAAIAACWNFTLNHLITWRA
ncbi:MAG: GtrA family protein [Chloroflexota bacterium]|nr:GtrA family protein [Chloroflexota bacterium]